MRYKIVEFINNDNEKHIAIGSPGYYKCNKNLRQVIRQVDVDVSEQQWNDMVSLTQEKLCHALYYVLNNSLASHYPN